jgi:hypothetical protein
MRAISRRSVLGLIVAVVPTAACVGDVSTTAVATCDIWTSSFGDCQTPAHFEYADPAVNAAHGPRRFCREHVGCATSALVATG